MQLEKILGKVKSGKYGSRILEEIANSSESGKPDAKLNGEEDHNVPKKAKTKTTPVLIDSSEDDE